MLAILSQIITVENLLMMNVGIFAGIIIGAMPGLSVTFAVSVMLTLSVGLESLPGMFLLLGTYCGGTYGGSIAAILIRTPGTAIPWPARAGPTTRCGPPSSAPRWAAC